MQRDTRQHGFERAERGYIAVTAHQGRRLGVTVVLGSTWSCGEIRDEATRAQEEKAENERICVYMCVRLLPNTNECEKQDAPAMHMRATIRMQRVMQMNEKNKAHE